jgi:hypothetical protein
MSEAQKSWFQKTEGKFGTAVTVAMLVAVGGLGIYFWGALLPWIISMLENTLTAIALAAIIAVIGVVVFDPRWRNLIVYGYKSLMRLLTSLFIEIDPIGILRTYVASLRAKLEDMDKSIANLRGQLIKLKEQIDKNESNRVQNLRMASEARKRGEEMHDTFVLKSRQAGRLEKSNMPLQSLYDKMDRLLKTLKKYRSASALLVEDIQNEVEVKTAERATLLAGYNAFSQARKIMQGGGDERELFDMTLEKLADDYGQKMGEIDVFMDLSKSIIDGAELDNGIYEADALAQLEAWEQNKDTSSLLSNAPKRPAVRVDVPTNVRVEDSGAGAEEEEEPSPDSFSDLFNKKGKP